MPSATYYSHTSNSVTFSPIRTHTEESCSNSGSFCGKLVKAVPVMIGALAGAGIGFLSTHENMKFTDWLYNERRSQEEVIGIYTGVVSVSAIVGSLGGYIAGKVICGMREALQF